MKHVLSCNRVNLWTGYATAMYTYLQFKSKYWFWIYPARDKTVCNRVWHMFIIKMAWRKLSDEQKWQVVGMSNTGASSWNIAEHFGVNHSIIVRLLQRYHADGTISERQQSGRPRKSTPREDRARSRLAQRKPSTVGCQLRDQWPIQERVSVCTVTRRRNNAGMNARRPVKRHCWHLGISRQDSSGPATDVPGTFVTGDVYIGRTNVSLFYATLTADYVFSDSVTLLIVL